MSGCSEQQIKEVMAAYVDGISAGDLDQVLTLFAEDAVVEDPVGSDPHRGHEALRRFYQFAISTVARMELDGAVRAREKWGAAAMKAYPRGSEGRMVVETLDVMEFNDEGKITRMTAYWGNGNLKSL